MLTCEEAEAELSAHLDGELSPEERAVLDAHLATCKNCSVAKEKIEASRKILMALPKIAAPSSLKAKISAAVREELASSRNVPADTKTPGTARLSAVQPAPELTEFAVPAIVPIRRHAGTWPVFASAAAAMVMVGLMGYVVLAPSVNEFNELALKSDARADSHLKRRATDRGHESLDESVAALNDAKKEVVEKEQLGAPTPSNPSIENDKAIDQSQRRALANAAPVPKASTDAAPKPGAALDALRARTLSDKAGDGVMRKQLAQDEKQESGNPAEARREEPAASAPAPKAQKGAPPAPAARSADAAQKLGGGNGAGNGIAAKDKAGADGGMAMQRGNAPSQAQDAQKADDKADLNPLNLVSIRTKNLAGTRTSLSELIKKYDATATNVPDNKIYILTVAATKRDELLSAIQALRDEGGKNPAPANRAGEALKNKAEEKAAALPGAAAKKIDDTAIIRVELIEE